MSFCCWFNGEQVTDVDSCKVPRYLYGQQFFWPKSLLSKVELTPAAFGSRFINKNRPRIGPDDYYKDLRDHALASSVVSRQGTLWPAETR
ncbi:hypothetical protein DAPPUDRAFT_239409 [Daphnia pulex]|uniref:Uncharacterized protein n=1 Tax=Daphnia pulex TaxID=6669 RepID=E9G987_DAPPU|nr:hypothetical protein DAPPUDRAFT_239409 [Daphnia pulex]|eukprot:EFX84129.1 hypothetical protein DAPPUDRAFT_239409 [Daphnia pulex]